MSKVSLYLGVLEGVLQIEVRNLCVLLRASLVRSCQLHFQNLHQV